MLAILLGGITFMLCQSLSRSLKPSISVEIGKTETPDVQLAGPGFSEYILREGTKPFLRGDAEEKSNHFGMGLYICRLMCEKHGGGLKLENNIAGARADAIIFCSR